MTGTVTGTVTGPATSASAPARAWDIVEGPTARLRRVALLLGMVLAAWAFLLFVLGNLVGTLVLAIGLLRSGSAPRWAALAIASWPPLHVLGLALLPNEGPQVVGATLQALGFAGCAVALWRRLRPLS